MAESGNRKIREPAWQALLLNRLPPLHERTRLSDTSGRQSRTGSFAVQLADRLSAASQSKDCQASLPGHLHYLWRPMVQLYAYVSVVSLPTGNFTGGAKCKGGGVVSVENLNDSVFNRRSFVFCTLAFAEMMGAVGERGCPR